MDGATINFGFQRSRESRGRASHVRQPIPTAVSTAHREPARLIATGHTNYNSLWYVGRDFLHRATLYVGQAFTGRVHRGNPFRKAAEPQRVSDQPRTGDAPDLSAPPPDAHTLVIQGGAPTVCHGALQIEGERGGRQPCSTAHSHRLPGCPWYAGTAPSTQLLPTSLRSTCAVTRGRHAHMSGHESRRAARRARRPHAQWHGSAASPRGSSFEFDPRMAYGMPSSIHVPLCISAAMSPPPLPMLHLGWKAAPRRLWCRRPARP